MNNKLLIIHLCNFHLMAEQEVLQSIDLQTLLAAMIEIRLKFDYKPSK
jgi:hypothetical protein